MRFLAPEFLLLLIPVAAGLWFSNRRLMGMAKFRKGLSTIVRGLLAACLIFALAQPQWERPNRGIATIVVLDRSESIPEAARKKQDEFVRELFGKLGEEELAGVVTVGKEASVEAIVAGRRPFGQVLSKVDGQGTDLSAAVRLATASFPEGKGRRIVLLTDGNETQGDLLAAAEVAATENIEIDYVPLDTAVPGEALVHGVEAPTQSPANAPISIRAIVEATAEQDGVLRLERNGLMISERTIRLPKGKSAVVFNDRIPEPGFHQYRVTLRGSKDADVRNNLGNAFVSVQSKPKILVLQTEPKSVFVEALRAQGIAVDVGTPSSLPTRPQQIQSYAAVIFNDINAAVFVPRQMEMIQRAVRDTGLGLAMVGGENSFLPGGYYGSPIAEALPVDLDIRNRKSFPSTSILILVDASGSMGAVEDGVQKIRLAAQAAEYTVKLLSPRDRVGVGGSTDGIEMVAPMQELTNKESVIAQIRRLSTGGGGIYIGATVKRAEQIMMAENSKVRHFILLADGADSEDPQDAIARTLRMRANRITTTVVAIGDGPDVPLLKNLAAAGGGRFFLAKKASQLPAIFTQDTANVARSAIEEGEFYPELMGGDEMIQGITRTPSLAAYCLTELKPLARLGMRTPKKDPLLASWQYGLGSSVAFTSDAHPRWAANWVTWSGYSQFWAQVSRFIARRPATGAYQASVQTDSGRPILRVVAQDRLGNARTDWGGKMRLGAPDGSSKELQLTQVKPGVYESPFDASHMGTYMATVAEPGPGGQTVSVTGFSVPYPAELRSVGASRPSLEQAAAVTGGREVKTPEEALRELRQPGSALTDFWRLLLFLALALLPVDVALRRIAIPFAEILLRSRSWLREKLSRAPASRDAEIERADRLRTAKQRAAAPIAASPSEPTAPEPVRRPKRELVRPPASAGGSASTKLLERKRERSQTDSKESP